MADNIYKSKYSGEKIDVLLDIISTIPDWAKQPTKPEYTAAEVDTYAKEEVDKKESALQSQIDDVNESKADKEDTYPKTEIEERLPKTIPLDSSININTLYGYQYLTNPTMYLIQSGGYGQSEFLFVYSSAKMIPPDYMEEEFATYQVKFSSVGVQYRVNMDWYNEQWSEWASYTTTKDLETKADKEDTYTKTEVDHRDDILSQNLDTVESNLLTALETKADKEEVEEVRKNSKYSDSKGETVDVTISNETVGTYVIPYGDELYLDNPFGDGAEEISVWIINNGVDSGVNTCISYRLDISKIDGTLDDSISSGRYYDSFETLNVESILYNYADEHGMDRYEHGLYIKGLTIKNEGYTDAIINIRKQGDSCKYISAKINDYTLNNIYKKINEKAPQIIPYEGGSRVDTAYPSTIDTLYGYRYDTPTMYTVQIDGYGQSEFLFVYNSLLYTDTMFTDDEYATHQVRLSPNGVQYRINRNMQANGWSEWVSYTTTKDIENKADKTTVINVSEPIYNFLFANLDNGVVRMGVAESISFTFGNGEYSEIYMSSLSFDSGATPTSIDYTDSGILNWVGTDCTTVDGLSIFQPSANTHYDIAFDFNGTQFIGLVNGFVPSVSR